MTTALLGSALLVLVVLAAIPDSGVAAEERVQKIMRLYGEGQLDAAEADFADASQSFASNHRIWLAGALLSEHRGNVALATQRYRSARSLIRSDDAFGIEIDITLCDLVRRGGDAAGALEQLDRLIKDAVILRIPGRWRHAKALALIDLIRYEEALSETRLLAEEEGGCGISRGLEAQIQRLSANVQVGGGHQAAASTPR